VGVERFDVATAQFRDELAAISTATG
jgi:hypothetical protein